jgi:hypothetical protein
VNPGKPLLAAADGPARERLEGRQHLLQRTAFFRDDDSRANLHRSHARLLRFALPILREAGQKIAAGSRALVEKFVVAVAVKSDRARVYQHSRFPARPSDRFDERTGGEDAAVDEPLLELAVPALVEEALAREVNHRVGAVDAPGAGAESRQLDRLVSPLGERLREVRSYQSARSGDCDFHAPRMPDRFERFEAFLRFACYRVAP